MGAGGGAGYIVSAPVSNGGAVRKVAPEQAG